MWSSEFSPLRTGYSTYSRNILSRLYQTGKYEIAEHASYGHPQDQRCAQIPWRLYGNYPTSEEEGKTYNQQSHDQFGKWSFNDAALHFQCDIVADIRDTWMYEHILSSPFRPFFHTAIMTACDGEPQNKDWLYLFQDIDSLFTYTDWSKETITRQTNEVIKPIRSLPPGADFEVFKPVPNKGQHKQRFGFTPDIFIVGMLSRNQKRKLFPDLFKAFRQFLNNQANSTIGRKTFLYLHTSWPDVGWNIPELLKEHGLSHKVLFTYSCDRCKLVFPCFFQDTKGVCPQCRNTNCRMPDTQFGLTDEALAAIYNLFDLYVQYANSEGAGMGQIEAAACGIPIMSVDYSAMADLTKKLRGYTIKVLHLSKESETGVNRAIPDNDSFIENLTKFLNLPATLRLKKGFDARRLCMEHYNYDSSAKGWEEYFDSVEVKDENQTWKSPPRLHNPITTVPNNLSFDQLISWATVNVLGDASKLNSYFHMRLLKDLNSGKHQEGFGGMYLPDNSLVSSFQKPQDYTPQQMLESLYRMCQERNLWEQRRCGMVPYSPPLCISRYKPDANNM